MTFKIDDITWNDLNIDEVLKGMDVCNSSVGSEVLKKTLSNLEFDEEILSARGQKADYFTENPSVAKNLAKIFKNLGKTKKVSFLEYIFKLNELPVRNNGIHIVLILLLLVSIGLIFVKPAIGIIALVAMIAINIILYFRYKASIEAYFNCVKYLVNMITAGESITKTTLGKDNSPFSDDVKALKELVKTFAPVKRGSWLITNSVSGSLIDVLMDYVRMIFHVDLMKFNSMHKLCTDKPDEIQKLYDILGGIETALCISAYRQKLAYYCEPGFTAAVKSVSAEEMCHPLVKNPVPNSILAEKSVLLTGSNASGKSTFLKMLAVNQIFAQTIYTCFAKSFQTSFYKVLSSMALTDNILGEESYFVVEVKSLKRMFDQLEENVPVMLFVDEVLRGTNTKERIAASSQILKELCGQNALCFAATHDIELTHILESDMLNYHFSETVENDQVLFDYKLKEGRATSRNAIKLLNAYGFPKSIIESASDMADRI